MPAGHSRRDRSHFVPTWPDPVPFYEGGGEGITDLPVIGCLPFTGIGLYDLGCSTVRSSAKRGASNHHRDCELDPGVEFEPDMNV